MQRELLLVQLLVVAYFSDYRTMENKKVELCKKQ